MFRLSSDDCGSGANVSPEPEVEVEAEVETATCNFYDLYPGQFVAVIYDSNRFNFIRCRTKKSDENQYW